MNNSFLFLIVAVAFLATLGNLVWETWDYGFPANLPRPDEEPDNNKEFWDLLSIIYHSGKNNLRSCDLSDNTRRGL